jgi:hypothetical protein
MADMFVQVFIERDRRYQTSMVTVHLYFRGVDYLKFKYPDELMENFDIQSLPLITSTPSAEQTRKLDTIIFPAGLIF